MSISYNGGNTMSNGSSIYSIFYGNWNESTQNIITTFINQLSYTNYWNIVDLYFNNNVNTTNVTSVVDNYSLGYNLTDVLIQTLVTNTFVNNDPDGIYVVFSYNDVYVPGLCTSFCSYHSYFNTTKYVFIGDTTGCPLECASQLINGSINNDLQADGIINLLSYEIVDTMTDPYINGWYGNSSNQEISDLCYNNFGLLQYINKIPYNIEINSNKYLIQSIWDIDTNSCELNITSRVFTTTDITTDTIIYSTTDTIITTTDNSTTDNSTTDIISTTDINTEEYENTSEIIIETTDTIITSDSTTDSTTDNISTTDISTTDINTTDIISTTDINTEEYENTSEIIIETTEYLYIPYEKRSIVSQLNVPLYSDSKRMIPFFNYLLFI